LDRYLKLGIDPTLAAAVEASAEAPPTSAENDASIVIEILVNGVPRALMASDAGAVVLKEVTNNKQYPFLKVPHHGSDTGLDEELIRQIRPANAAIPVGENPHGHPCIEILDLLRGNGATTYCSSKTKNCRRLWTFKGGNVCFPIGKTSHPGWTTIDTAQCKNNVKPHAAF
jgi:beta-lactamase superfamily II metal-dependent hydrolase